MVKCFIVSMKSQIIINRNNNFPCSWFCCLGELISTHDKRFQQYDTFCREEKREATFENQFSVFLLDILKSLESSIMEYAFT